MAIYIPNSGGISTKDATAIPSDVATGKVFYNADGRQVGSGKVFCEKSIVPINNGSYEMLSSVDYEIHYSDNGSLKSIYEDTSPFKQKYRCKLSLPDAIAIVALTINNNRINLAFPLVNSFFNYNYNRGDLLVVYDFNSSCNMGYVHNNYGGGPEKGWYMYNADKYSIVVHYIELE